MRRRFVAVVWIAGATVPLVMVTVFVFGCCVLPFHQVVHKLMPVCEMAAQAMRGVHQEEAPPPAPAREKQDPILRAQQIAASPALCPLPSALPRVNASSRNFLSLGAMRCDQDVGLHVLIDTFRI